MRVVLSDTSPIRYLVLIGEAEVLPKLYGRVLIPSSVAAELNQRRTPEKVKDWISRPPDWIEIVQVTSGLIRLSPTLTQASTTHSP